MSSSSRNVVQKGRALASAFVLIVAFAVAAMAGVACKENTGHTAMAVDDSDCVACHRDEYELAVAPVHVAQLPLNCEGCHNYTTWSPARGSDHDQYFPLQFAHAKVGCGTCHSNGFEPGDTSSDCVACHQDDYEAAVDPPHDGFSTECQDCHTPAGWTLGADGGMGFVHSWPLIGHHATAACSGCHVGDPPVYAGTPKDCVACHQADYDNATNPSHDGFPTDCASCHTPKGWQGASAGPGFVHSWPLEGNHATTPCTSCHVGDPPVYAGTPKDCVSCHQADYDNATNPNHDGFSTDCASCHTPDGWTGAVAGPGFVHPWPLNGTHATTPCASCHVGDPPVYAGTPTTCVDCHAADRDAANPPHDGFSDDCASCHNETSFTPATFDHPWPLTGAHDSAACTSCHVGDPPVYAGTPKDCVACHQADYDSSPYPGHDSFPTDCVSCHTTTAWTPASGGHPEDRFSITGRHNYPCMDCHNSALGPMGKDNTDCVGCHTGAHTRSTMDGKHTDVNNYPTGTAPPNFCLDCHPRGTNNG